MEASKNGILECYPEQNQRKDTYTFHRYRMHIEKAKRGRRGSHSETELTVAMNIYGCGGGGNREHLLLGRSGSLIWHILSHIV